MKYSPLFTALLVLISIGCGPGDSDKPADDRKSADPELSEKDSVAMAEIEAQMVIKSMDVAIRNYMDADIELNKLWDKLKSVLEESEMAALTKKQIAWIKEKESTCRKEANQEFPDPKPDNLEKDPYWISVNNFCLASKTADRIAELQIILEKNSPKAIGQSTSLRAQLTGVDFIPDIGLSMSFEDAGGKSWHFSAFDFVIDPENNEWFTSESSEKSIFPEYRPRPAAMKNFYTITYEYQILDIGAGTDTQMVVTAIIR